MSGNPKNTETTCSDGIDNDEDGYTDCYDYECKQTIFCTSENTAVACSDLKDNDGDGFVDCGDFDCNGTAVCQEK